MTYRCHRRDMLKRSGTAVAALLGAGADTAPRKGVIVGHPEAAKVGRLRADPFWGQRSDPHLP